MQEILDRLSKSGTVCTYAGFFSVHLEVNLGANILTAVSRTQQLV